MAAVDPCRGLGFVAIMLPGLLVDSCYLIPGGPFEHFRSFLDGLEADIRSRLLPEMGLIVAGDFNAKSQSWGSVIGDARGRILERFSATLGLKMSAPFPPLRWAIAPRWFMWLSLHCRGSRPSRGGKWETTSSVTVTIVTYNSRWLHHLWRPAAWRRRAGPYVGWIDWSFRNCLCDMLPWEPHH